MSFPLIPTGHDEARALWTLIVDDIESRISSDGTAIRLLATECVAHMANLMQREPPGIRVVVLAGPDRHAAVGLATAAATAMDLPHAVVPITSMSESGWAGRNLADWLRNLEADATRKPWIRRALVVLSGLDALRIESGTYHASSSSTHDYRLGKAENVSSMLRCEPVPWSLGDSMWDAKRAMVVLTTTYDRPEHDADALADWGLTPELAGLLAATTWIHVPEAVGRVAEYAVWDALRPLRRLYEVYGILLEIADETVQRAARQAAVRGESAAVAAAWIAEPGRRKLVEMLASTNWRTYVVLAPDDCPPPPRARPKWVD